MKLDLSKVEFSHKDISNKIKIPKNLTDELAYLIGIHVGDGYMDAYKRKNKSFIDYKLEYSGHLIDEEEFHKKIIQKLFKSLFNKDTSVYFDKRENHSSIKTYFRSKAILTFFHYSIGLPLGSKKDIKIPKIIKKSNIKIKKAFLKGLADTEFCLTFKKRYREKHYYPSIKFATQSKFLKNAVFKILNSLNLKLTTISDYITYRNNTKTISNIVDINGITNLDLWMKEIGFNSSKHLTKYEVWKVFGFCPPNTNIKERQNILKGEVDINSYY